MLGKEKSLSNRGLSGKKKNYKFIRPNSANTKKGYYTIKTNNNPYKQAPPPIIFTMPANKKMISGMGNNIEREQLYENNMQLKESINKLRRELAETKYNVFKKDNELREKEKIIRDCLKENDLESANVNKIEKAKESALLTLCKEKYNLLKNSYQKEKEENNILKANIKITKIKEYQIENDILNNQLLKIKSLYENSQNNLKKYKEVVNDLNHFKEKFLKQHSIISSYAQKCDLLNSELRNLKEERDNLLKDLEINIKKQEKLKISNDKLKIKNLQFLNQKKIKEQKELKNAINEQDLLKYKKHAYEFKKAFHQKLVDYTELKKICDVYQKKLDNLDERLLKPFQYKNIKQIEQENNPKNIDKVELYKSLYNESQIINSIYEKYLKEINVNPKDIIRKYGYLGILNTENNRTSAKNKDISLGNKINLEKEMNDKNKKEENKKKIQNNNENKKDEEINILDKVPNNNQIINNFQNKILSSYNNDKNVFPIKEKNEDDYEEEEEEKQNINQIGNNSDNFSNVNTNLNTKSNTVYNNYNLINNNNNGEENKSEKIDEEKENKILNIIHIFLKNLEANHITKEIINEKMYSIFESFEGKSEATKEDFILPFYNLMVELMKVTKEGDKQIIHEFFSDYIDALNGNTNSFFNELYEIFQNLNDYSNLSNNEKLLNDLALNLQRFKIDLEKRFKEEDKKETFIITFDIFKNIINDINIPLNDELMEYLIYKMKSSVPENYSILDLNYKIIFELLNREIEGVLEEEEEERETEELSKQISDKLSEFKNNMIKDNTDLEKVCKNYIKAFKNEVNDFEVIEKDKFFEIMENYGVIVDEKIKDTIYRLFINEEPICNNDGKIMMMDFKKLKNLFLNDYYSEEN